MKNRNLLLTDTVREIAHTKKKFISLLIMNFLAVGFLAGLRMTAPDMKHSLDVYYDQQNLMDIRIVSTLGLTQDDIEALMDINTEFTSDKEAKKRLPVITDAEGSKYFDALIDEDTVTVFSMPEKINRLRLTQGVYPGSREECIIEQLLADKLGIGVGDRITINTEDADKLTTDELDPLDCYGDQEYKDMIRDLIDCLKPLGKRRAGIRHEQLISEATITDMMAQIFSTGLSSIGVESGKWYIHDRNSLESYGEFAMDSERMSNLADVFPMIFFLVAALSSLTTMTRMVEEHRTQIGSMKALGFSGRDIGIKYIGYALASSLGGGLAGWICGIFAIPGIIYYEWGLEYLLSPVKFLFSPAVLAYSVGFAVLATAGAAAAACQTTLSASAASLMRPRAPKPGKRVLLEKIPPIWSRLSFIQKVSVRNLFRYKRRFLMTVAGIGGCTALVVTGLGLRDSIFDILDWQFDEITCYDAALGISEDIRADDKVHLKENDDEEEFTAEVLDITENYVNHYVYMTRKCWKNMTGDWPLYNTILLRLTDGAKEEDTARKLIAIDGAISYNRIDQMRTRFEGSIRSINAIIVIIITAAAILAFLVLFNLTNINVTERIRELATLKVLGFYDKETASYVYRENGFLTLIGALIGLFMGKWLHSWLIRTVEVDFLMFGRSVHTRSYILAAILTFVFSLSVNFFSYFTIKDIDMVQSLKSVE
ncbi:MAG: ABC transporter permease [Lachnospiraceae bacterium]|nr:ABC transporter permease [Lachnospiraceae bacterium]